MKKIFTLSVAIIFSVNVFSQAPAIQWQKCLGGTGAEKANSIRQTNDGGYIIIGWSTSNNGDATANHGGQDFWVVKINANGIIHGRNH